ARPAARARLRFRSPHTSRSGKLRYSDVGKPRALIWRRAGEHLSGFEQVTAAQVGLERLGYGHRAVRPLVVLQNRDDPPSGRQRAVERRGGLRLAVGVPEPDVQPPGLERGAVRRRGELPVTIL